MVSRLIQLPMRREEIALSLLAVLCLTLALVCGCGPEPVRPERGKAAAAVQAGLLEIEASPAPAPQPRPAVCESCGGSGWVGDGRTRLRCQACNPGHGDAAPNPAEQCPTRPTPREPEATKAETVEAESPAAPQIKWHVSYCTAEGTAQREGKVLWVHVKKRSGCGRCVLFTERVAADPGFVAAAGAVVAVKVAAEDSPQWVADQGITSFPADLFLRPGGGRLLTRLPAEPLAAERELRRIVASLAEEQPPQ